MFPLILIKLLIKTYTDICGFKFFNVLKYHHTVNIICNWNFFLYIIPGKSYRSNYFSRYGRIYMWTYLKTRAEIQFNKYLWSTTMCQALFCACWGYNSNQDRQNCLPLGFHSLPLCRHPLVSLTILAYVFANTTYNLLFNNNMNSIVWYTRTYSAIYLFDIHLCFILIFTINATINIHITYIQCNDAFISSEEWVFKSRIADSGGVCVYA